MRDATTRPVSSPAGGMLREVADGLSRPQKELPPKYFYDARGSQLFDEITRLPEYYLTRVERALLAEHSPAWLASLAPASLVELGAGSGDKTRILLDALRTGAWYVPVDISASYLETIAGDIGGEYPHLNVVPSQSDMSVHLSVPEDLPRPTVVAFLGSTIGNFDPPAATRLLSRVRRVMGQDDRLLMGADLRKDTAVIEAAYNDERGVTAEFNRNILRVLNRELGADFDIRAFDHVAFYDARLGRIEMHLSARAPQTVRIPRIGEVEVAAGESIRTEISCKYDRATIDALFSSAGLAVEDWFTDDAATYALVTARPVR